MKKTMTAKLENTNSAFLAVLKGALISVACSLIGILLFALLLKLVNISDNAIKPINQIIKGISILIGCFVGLRKIRSMGLINGLIIGLLYCLVSFLVFSLLDGSFSFSITVLNDLLFCGIMGGICGIIAVNFLKKK